MIESNLVDLTATSTKELLQDVSDCKTDEVDTSIAANVVPSSSATTTESTSTNKNANMTSTSASSATPTSVIGSEKSSLANHDKPHYHHHHQNRQNYANNSNNKFRKPVHPFYNNHQLFAHSPYIPSFGFPPSSSSQYFLSASTALTHFGSNPTSAVGNSSSSAAAAGGGGTHGSNYFYSTNTYESKQSFANHRNYLQAKKFQVGTEIYEIFSLYFGVPIV